MPTREATAEDGVPATAPAAPEPAEPAALEATAPAAPDATVASPAAPTAPGSPGSPTAPATHGDAPATVPPTRESVPAVGESVAATREPAPVTREVGRAPATQAAASGAIPAAATAPTRARPEERRAGPGAVLLGLALLAAVVVAGLVIGRASGGSDESTPAASNVNASGALELSYPDDWQRAERPPEIPGLTVRNPIAVSKQGGGARDVLVTGTTGATGPSLLPAAFLSRLGDTPPRDDAVRLGDLDAYRYRDLRPEGFDGRLTVYVAPTTTGVVTVACTAADQQREDIPSRLRGRGRRAQADPRRALRAWSRQGLPGEARRSLRSGSTASARGGSALRKAKTQDGQAKAAASLARSYGRARRSLQGGSVSPAVRDAAASLRTALARAEAAYLRLSLAAKRGNTGAYDAVRTDVRRAEAAVKRALSDVRAASGG